MSSGGCATPVSAALDLRLPDVRALLSERLAGRPTRANFRTGTLTVCTMVPMRSVPHRVVCLLGLDDGVFPRQGSVDGDDVLARDPLTGERDARSEDRQLLLDAILAATQTLVVTYTGANEFSGQPRPPATPLGEVLDALDRTATPADGGPVSASVTTPPSAPAVRRQERHSRRPRGRRGVLLRPAAAAGARAATGPRVPPTPFLAGPLPRGRADRRVARRPGALLVRPGQGVPGARRRRPRARRPTRSIRRTACRSRSTASRSGPSVTASSATCSRASTPTPSSSASGGGGSCPPSAWDGGCSTRSWRHATPLCAQAAELRQTEPRAVDVSVHLGGDRWLRGTVPQVYGDRVVAVTYSRLAAKHRLASWVQLLALSASDEDRSWTAHTIGRATRRVARGDRHLAARAPRPHRGRRPA